MRLVFERFRLEGSAYAVLRYFMKNGLKQARPLDAQSAEGHQEPGK